MTAATRAPGAAGTSPAAWDAATVDWLSRVVETRNLGLEPPSSEHAPALLWLLATLSREFAEYGEVVAGARDAARRNAEQLGIVVRSTSEQESLVRATAQAAADAGSGAVRMAQSAGALHDFAQAAATAANAAGDHLTSIDAALRDLALRLAEGDRPLGEMRRSTAGVAAFLSTLARLSRHAQLLGVNASIEAAHLAEAGSRFEIVAQEVRKLSTSTRESKADVAQIVGELRESTDHVAASIGESKTAANAAAGEISGAGGALSRTGTGIAQFEQMVATVADVAAAQRVALESIGSSIDTIAHHADEAATASQTAAQLDLDTLLRNAHARVGRWALRAGPPTDLAAGDAFATWIASMSAGCDPMAPSPLDDDEGLRPLADAVRKLITRVSAEQREILGDVVQAAVAVSRNSYAWRSISEALDGLNREIGLVRSTVAESAGAARTSAQLAEQMHELADTIRTQYDAALTLLEGALSRISRITGSVGEIDGFVESMGTAAARADRIMGLIETISAETDLLSLNAAIEAAHAGELGLGFSVIAEEIRALARSTNESTVSVSRMVSSISQISADLQQSIGAAAGSMEHVAGRADGARSAIATLRETFESALHHAQDVSTTAAEQNGALDRVLDNVNRSSSAAPDNTTGSTDKGRLELAMLGSRAHFIAARRPLGTVIERVRGLTEQLCDRLEAAIDEALRSGRTNRERLFDLSYAPIEGPAISSLARLFDVSRVPQSGFTPVKYATPWDASIDEAMIDVLTGGWEEALAAAISPVTIFVSDLNGLFFAYPRQKIGPWTNDPAIDGLGNRIKRLFEDDYTLRVVRTGLGPQAAPLGPRCSYDVFRSAGCDLDQTANRPWGGYVYARDTSAVCNEVVMALYAAGLRFATLRVCYDPTLI